MRKMPAEPGQNCPFMQRDVSEVCHTCALYVQVRGINHNTGHEVDHWGCSFAFLPMMLIENTGQQRQTGAAIESLRNETAKSLPPALRLVAQLEHKE